MLQYNLNFNMIDYSNDGNGKHQSCGGQISLIGSTSDAHWNSEIEAFGRDKIEVKANLRVAIEKHIAELTKELDQLNKLDSASGNE